MSDHRDELLAAYKEIERLRCEADERNKWMKAQAEIVKELKAEISHKDTAMSKLVQHAEQLKAELAVDIDLLKKGADDLETVVKENRRLKERIGKLRESLVWILENFHRGNFGHVNGKQALDQHTNELEKALTEDDKNANP